MHGLLEIPGLEANFTAIQALADWSESQIRGIGGKYTGGPLLYRMSTDLEAMVSNPTSAYKYVHVSPPFFFFFFFSFKRTINSDSQSLFVSNILAFWT
jgi:hypothetical protein